tara:strand:- start:824 stop:1318 length:495 start_codon:yes stop_codon:yes gene_type:complete
MRAPTLFVIDRTFFSALIIKDKRDHKSWIASLSTPKVARVSSPVRCGMVLDFAVAVVEVVDAAHPGDTGPLETWLEANPLAEVLCILGKTEGNGCVNDYTRGYATSAIKDALRRVQSRMIERASDDMRRTHPGLYDGMEDAAIIMSGGTEGEHSPKTALNFVST